MHLTYSNLPPPTSSILSSKHRNNANRLFCVDLVNMLIVPAWNVTSVTAYQLKNTFKKGIKSWFSWKKGRFLVIQCPLLLIVLTILFSRTSAFLPRQAHPAIPNRSADWHFIINLDFGPWRVGCSEVIPKVTVTVLLQGGQSILSSSWLLRDGGSARYDW